MKTAQQVVKLSIPWYKSALSENRLLRYFTFTILYFAQGIPEGYTFFAIPAWLVANGVPTMQIASYMAVIMIPWTFKILIAPIMDRYTFLPMGRRRPWIICAQFGIVLSFISVGFIPFTFQNITGLMVAGFMISFCSAFQDVATDGMAIDIIPVKEQGKANSFMWGSKTIGISASLATGSWLINSIGIEKAVIIPSAMVLLILSIPILLRERSGEKRMPWSGGEASKESKRIHLHSWRGIIKSLVRVSGMKAGVKIFFMLFFAQLSFGLMDTLLKVFTINETGWTDIMYSQWLSTSILTAGIVGMVVGGIAITYFGKRKMLNIYYGALIILSIMMAFSSSQWNNLLFLRGFIMVYFTFYTLSVITQLALAMQVCWKKIAATQFTLFMAVSNLGLALGAKLFGNLESFLSWRYLFLAFSVFVLIPLIIFVFVKLNNHKVALEKMDGENSVVKELV